MNARAKTRDDPGSVSRLVAKLEAAQRRRELMHAVNRVVRDPAFDPAARYARVAAECARHSTSIEELTRGEFSVTSGFPRYAEINAAATVQRLRRQLEEIGRSVPRSSVLRFEGGRMEYEAARTRVRIYFRMPEPDVIARLVASGFQWTPEPGCWQRGGGAAAVRAAARAVRVEWPPAESDGAKNGAGPSERTVARQPGVSGFRA